MGMFDKIKGPVFLKESSTMEEQLTVLTEMKKTAPPEIAKRIEQDIKNINMGNLGENNVLFELKNSHMPMMVLHDLYFEYDGLTAQIDFLLVTRRHNYVIECKNLYGDIEIDSNGNFMRVIRKNGQYVKEGLYSPITQSQRHVDLIKRMRTEEWGNTFTKTLYEKGFFIYDNYIPLVVLANSKAVLNDKHAKKEVKEKVIRADQLICYIRDFEAASSIAPMKEKDMEYLGRYFLSKHKINLTDYSQKYAAVMPVAASEQGILCPKCGAPMVKRTAGKGQNAGKSFYGCSNFPECKGTVSVG